MRTRSADVLIFMGDKPVAGQSGCSFEASNEFEEFIDRVEAAQGQCMTSRELNGQDFTIDMSAVANLSDTTDDSVFMMLWKAWQNAEDLKVKLAVKKKTYAGSETAAANVDDLLESTMKIETFSGEFEDGLAGLEVSLVANGAVAKTTTASQS